MSERNIALNFRCAILLGASLSVGCDEDSSASGAPAVEARAQESLAHATEGYDVSQVVGSLNVQDLLEASERSFEVSQLLKTLSSRMVTSIDPYYHKEKRFWAVGAAELFKSVFSLSDEALESSLFSLEASDGYAVRLEGRVVSDAAAFFAFADVDADPFEPIPGRGVEPGPLYLIWQGDRADEKKYPRPWGIVRLRRISPQHGRERTVPTGGFGDHSLAKKGNDIFVANCVRCHSINQQGGKLGPDLNVPQNILAYRPEAQVRAYIKNPLIFRYGTMPAHPHLSEEHLDALIAYLRLMGKNQWDPQEEPLKVEK